MNNMRPTRIQSSILLPVLLSLPTLAACDGMTEESVADNSDRSMQAQEKWYSMNPLDQHGKMTYDAKNAASGYGVTWDCSRKKYIFFYDYRGQLCDGNVATDDTTASGNVAFFTALFGDRAHSQNHHFLRDGAEGLDTACTNAKADLYVGTVTALSWRAAGDDANFQRAIGVITHIIQDSFAPAHTRRDASSANYSHLLDLCSIHEDVPGACRHPEPFFPQSADDADVNPTLAGLAVSATTDYLIAVAKVATNQDPNALGPAIEKWFQCP